MSPRVQLVTPNWAWDDSPLPVDTLRPPPSLPLEYAYLAADLGPAAEVQVFDGYVTGVELKQLADQVRSFGPTAVVVSTTPSLLYWRCPPMTVKAVQVAVSAIREAADCPVVLIGPHASFTPDWALRETGADACWRGAFERGLATSLVEGFDATSPHMYVGTGQGKAVSRPGSIAVLPANQLPTADFRPFDRSVRYPPHMWCVNDEERSLAASLVSGALLEASRGCPWACAYCAKGPVRDRFGRRPLPNLKDELLDLVARGIDYVFFIDETFNVPGHALDELLELLAGLPLSFGFQGRADLMSPVMCDALAAAGCVYAELGVDVVSDALAKDIGRRQHLDRSERGIGTAQAAIPIVRFNRLNLRTIDYIDMYGDNDGGDWEFPPDPAYPYPGAPLGRELMAQFGISDFDWGFAERYAWWLRLEVHLQRTQPHLSVTTVRELQRTFLALDREAASALARLLEPLTVVPGFHDANKSVNGEGARVRLRDTGEE
ncbi:radical SAM protein [Streptomyces sp. NPDC005407]|uniref:B12-binding domain-containing radical SAM protein n=1 Tax=Streptomyces sp. NPDC005407 TaxID=3155340 RepID=UPI0033AC4E88